MKDQYGQSPSGETNMLRRRMELLREIHELEEMGDPEDRLPRLRNQLYEIEVIITKWRRIPPPELGAIEHLETWQILEKVAHGGKLKRVEVDAVVGSTATMRHEFLKEAFGIVEQLGPGTEEFRGFENCMKSIGTLFLQHGIVSADEMSALWLRIEEKKR